MLVLLMLAGCLGGCVIKERVFDPYLQVIGPAGVPPTARSSDISTMPSGTIKSCVEANRDHSLPAKERDGVGSESAKSSAL